jgi:hypothetical protein
MTKPVFVGHLMGFRVPRLTDVARLCGNPRAVSCKDEWPEADSRSTHVGVLARHPLMRDGTCDTCGTTLSGGSTQFCSITCRSVWRSAMSFDGLAQPDYDYGDEDPEHARFGDGASSGDLLHDTTAERTGVSQQRESFAIVGDTSIGSPQQSSPNPTSNIRYRVERDLDAERALHMEVCELLVVWRRDSPSTYSYRVTGFVRPRQGCRIPSADDNVCIYVHIEALVYDSQGEIIDGGDWLFDLRDFTQVQYFKFIFDGFATPVERFVVFPSALLLRVSQ